MPQLSDHVGAITAKLILFIERHDQLTLRQDGKFQSSLAVANTCMVFAGG